MRPLLHVYCQPTRHAQRKSLKSSESAPSGHGPAHPHARRTRRKLRALYPPSPPISTIACMRMPRTRAYSSSASSSWQGRTGEGQGWGRREEAVGRWQWPGREQRCPVALEEWRQGRDAWVLSAPGAGTDGPDQQRPCCPALPAAHAQHTGTCRRSSTAAGAQRIGSGCPAHQQLGPAPRISACLAAAAPPCPPLTGLRAASAASPPATLPTHRVLTHSCHAVPECSPAQGRRPAAAAAV